MPESDLDNSGDLGPQPKGVDNCTYLRGPPPVLSEVVTCNRVPETRGGTRGRRRGLLKKGSALVWLPRRSIHLAVRHAVLVAQWVTGFSFFHCVASPFHSFVTTSSSPELRLLLAAAGNKMDMASKMFTLHLHTSCHLSAGSRSAIMPTPAEPHRTFGEQCREVAQNGAHAGEHTDASIVMLSSQKGPALACTRMRGTRRKAAVGPGKGPR